MTEVELEAIRKRIHVAYRRHSMTLARLEKKFIDTPSEELKREVAEQQGFLRGLKKGLEFVEIKANDNQFDLGGA